MYSACFHMGARRRVRFECARCGLELDADVNRAQILAIVGGFVTSREHLLLNCPLPQWAAEVAGKSRRLQATVGYSRAFI